MVQARQAAASSPFAQFADALSQCKGQDVSTLLDPANGLAIWFADICAQRAQSALEEAGMSDFEHALDARVQARSAGLRNEPVNGLLDLYDDDDGDDAMAWKLEEQTWRLIQQLHAERTQRSKDGQATSVASTSKSNPYTTPLSAVQAILEADPALAELNIVREWLSGNFTCKNPVEVRKGYWPFTKNKLRSDRRTALTSADPASSSNDQRNRLSAYGSLKGSATRGNSGARNGVRSLDPDATTRESSTLELEDVAYEKALNKTLFEYARGGQVNDAIDLARQTDRSWRAASLRGANLYWRPGLDDDDQIVTEEQLSSPMGNRNRTLWKAVCRSLSATQSLDDYERALYGALSGDLKSVIHVSTSWDAQLWAYTNARLEAAIDARLDESGSWWSQAPDESLLSGSINGTRESGAVRLTELSVPRDNSDSALHKGDLSSEAPLAAELRDVFVRLSQTEQHGIHLQANHPFRMVQRAVILSELPALLVHVESFLPSMRVSISAQQYARLVRFFAHLILFLRLIKWEKMPNDIVCNSILKSYVDTLEGIGGRGEDDLVALYASSLEPESATESYAHYLKTMDPHESIDAKRTALLRAQTHDLDVAAVANVTVTMIFDELYPTLTPATLEGFTITKDPLDQLTTTLTPYEDRLIRAIDWLYIHDSTHIDAIYHVNALVRLFLNSGRLDAARKVLFDIPSAVLEKIGDIEAQGDPELQAVEFVHWRSFFEAIDGHLRFVEVWSRSPAQKASRSEQLAWAKGLNVVVRDAREAIVQVLEMDWIKLSLLPQGDVVADELQYKRSMVLARIRQLYVPELVVRLHSMLYTTRDTLPTSLAAAVQLPNLVADERHKLYLDFINGEENRLGDFMQRVRTVELASLAVHPDPFHLSSAPLE